MAKIQNSFSRGVVDKDNDERYVAPDTLIDAENFVVSTTEGSNLGVGKNVPGNVKSSNFNIPGAKTIGVGINESEDLIYNFVKGTLHDYIIEYNVETEAYDIVMQATTGGVLNFIEGERIRNVDIISSGEPLDTLIAWSGDSNPPRIANIAIAKTWAIDGFTDVEISVMKPAPVFSPIIQNLSTTENDGVFITERFVSFAYRWKYKSGYYSAISTWSEYVFTPKDFDFNFDTFENFGMINAFNKVRINFSTGGVDVIGVEVLFKESNNETVYVIDKFDKTKEGWGNNQTKTIDFSSNKIYTVLPPSQYHRNFDNVPLSAVAQTMIGNRIAYANFIEQRDIKDAEGNTIEIDLGLSFTATPIGSKKIPSQFLSAPYTVDIDTYTLNETRLSFDLSNIIFKLGAILEIDFLLESHTNVPGRDPEISKFKNTFIYEMEADFTDFSDFYTNSLFKNQIEVALSAIFQTEALVMPDDGTLTDFQEFVVTNPSGSIINIKSPMFVFTIDNTIDPPYFLMEAFKHTATTVSYSVFGSNRSMHSHREYEVCQIYLDPQGRKTTALVSRGNSVYIPIENCDTKNMLVVDVNHEPPSWATHYKFGIKQTNKIYETIVANIFYEEGVYRWIQLEGSNKNKVKEGDVLVVKADRKGPLNTLVKVRVLDVKEQTKEFIPDNTDASGVNIQEQAGLYFKIRPNNIDINYNESEFFSDRSFGNTLYDRPIIYVDLFSFEDPLNPGQYIDRALTPGDVIIFYFESFRKGRDSAVFRKTVPVNGMYDSFEEFFAEVLASEQWVSSTGDPYETPEFVRGDVVYGITQEFTANPTGKLWLKLKGIYAGNAFNRPGNVLAEISLRNVDGVVVFEKEYEDTIDTPFFETPETFIIEDGHHEAVSHTLSRTFNCFCFGNGVESYQIKDVFNAKYLNLDFKPTDVSEDEYKQINRFADITYSGVFNSNTNVNRLNEFNLSLANYKDDIEKVYGPIMKIVGEDTNLEVYQEDKCSYVFYGKDMLYNTDGTGNVGRIEEVLGQQKTYLGEYGISFHPDSFDNYAFDSFLTDVKRGVVLKKNNSNGLFEISSQGMRNYFKKLFRDNTITHINGKYDQFHDYYILNIQYGENQYVTWLYSDKNNGWMGRVTFNPEDMVRINNHLISFKNGEVYKHNQTSVYNTFYGEESPSKLSFNFSQDPSIRKNFKAVDIEGTDAWKLNVKTDFDNGYVNKEDFVKKEGVFYAYFRNNNDVVDTSLLSCQGIGEVTAVNGLVITVQNPIIETISVGDVVRNVDLEVIGTIVSKTEKTMTMNAVTNLVVGDFVLATKNQSIENQSLLGYYMQVDCELTKNTATEVYALSAEISVSKA